MQTWKEPESARALICSYLYFFHIVNIPKPLQTFEFPKLDFIWIWIKTIEVEIKNTELLDKTE